MGPREPAGPGPFLPILVLCAREPLSSRSLPALFPLSSHPSAVRARHTQLASELAVAEESLAEDEAASLRKQIDAREKALLPLYTQI
eukprot:3573251-Prymnesium_polylepis.1